VSNLTNKRAKVFHMGGIQVTEIWKKKNKRNERDCKYMS